MNLHEYQAKNLFRNEGLPVPRGGSARTPDEAAKIAHSLAGKVVVKAQIHAGGRGKAGGVRFAASPDECAEIAGAMLGTRLTTYQSGPEGLPVDTVLVEEVLSLERELYLSALIDRSLRRLILVGSGAGGVDIEQVAAETPERISKLAISPIAGLQPHQCRSLARALELGGDAARDLATIAHGLVHMFNRYDLSLVELNPLAVTTDGRLVCADGKINVDDNALYRQAGMAKLSDPNQMDRREREAQQHDLSYVSLSGNVGCMVNGAGLSMATMDAIHFEGAAPSNFLDVGGSATSDRVAEAFRIILSDSGVKAILINIFGGIVRCTEIAAGILEAVRGTGIQVPLVVRLEGTQAVEGRKMLAESDLDIIVANDLAEAAQKAAAAVGKIK